MDNYIVFLPSPASSTALSESLGALEALNVEPEYDRAFNREREFFAYAHNVFNRVTAHRPSVRVFAEAEAAGSLSAMSEATAEEANSLTDESILPSLQAFIAQLERAEAERLRSLGAHVIQDFEIPFDAPEIEPENVEPLSNAWHLEKINVTAARNKELTGSGVLVGVLDTGIDASHPEFAGKEIHFAEFSRDGKIISTTARDAGDHGTHVCGTIAGRTLGVAPDADLAVACVLNQIGLNGRLTTQFSVIVKAIDWLQRTDFDGRSVAVVNASLGGRGYISDLYGAVQTMRNVSNIGLIAAIGNLGERGVDNHGSPANYDVSLAVGNTDAQDNVNPSSDWGTVAEHNGLQKPELSAPGTSILSSIPGGGFGRMTGTSMASPCVAGAAALLIQQDPTLADDVDRLFGRLKALTVPLADRARAGVGRLDLTGV
ncbi:AprE Subtilisin-like serine proteases [Fimbriimonadaceae bacterium]